MSHSVELADIAAQVAELGPLAMFVSVTPETTAHVGTVLVTVGPSHLAVRVGARTREHIRANPSVTLTWLRDTSDYQLIVDGIAVVVDDADDDDLYAVEIDVRRAILHRLVGRVGGPTCRELGTASSV